MYSVDYVLHLDLFTFSHLIPITTQEVSANVGESFEMRGISNICFRENLSLVQNYKLIF